MHNKVVHTLSRAFHHCGYSTLRFNYRGVGQSKGQFGNYTGEIKDALSIINWLTQIQPNNQIVLAGFSFGAYVAASVCQQINAQALITIAPAVNHKDYIKLLPISCPWLIIHGEKDELVPINQVKEFIKHLHHNFEFKILENSSHFFHKNLIKLRNVIENYLKSLN